MSDQPANLDWQMPSVESANIARAAAEGGDLVVEYRSGHVYRYPGGAEMLGRLLSAESPGKWAGRHLRRMMHVKLK